VLHASADGADDTGGANGAGTETESRVGTGTEAETGTVARTETETGTGAPKASAVAVTGASAGGDVGLTDFEGVVEYDLGTATAVSIPRVDSGGSDAANRETIADLAGSHDLIATAGAEALVTAGGADIEPDVRFGTPEAVREAATKGLNVLLLATTDELSAHTDRLHEANLGYEVVDAAED
jgi:putative transcriptional regulator